MAYKRISPQPIVEGGTGAQTLTNHGVLLGQATSAIVATSVGATGTVLAGNTGVDPTFQALTGLAVTSLTGTANQVLVNATSGSAQVGALTVAFPATAGISIGSYGATVAPVGGIIAPGVVSFGANAALGTEQIRVTKAGVGPQVISLFENSDIDPATSESRIVLAEGGSYYQGIAGRFNSGAPFMGFSVSGSLSPNTWNGVATMWSNGGMAIGRTYYSGLNIPPDDGLIVQSQLGVNSTSSSAARSGGVTRAFFVGDDTFSPIFENGQIYIGGQTTPGKKLLIGYDTTSNFAWLQSNTAGVGTNILSLNPAGSNVGVGTTGPAAKFTVFDISTVRSGETGTIQIVGTQGSGGIPRLTLGINYSGTAMNYAYINAVENGVLNRPLYIQGGGAGTSIGADTAPLSTLDVFGSLAGGTYAGTSAAPSNSFIYSGTGSFGSATMPSTTDNAAKLYVAGGGVWINTGQIYAFRADVATTGHAGFWMGQINADTWMNANSDTGTPRYYNFSTSSNDLSTGTLRTGFKVSPLLSTATVGDSTWSFPLTGNVTDSNRYNLTISPFYTVADGGSHTITRQNYMYINQPVETETSGTITITDGEVMYFNAAVGTHVCLDAGTTKTTPGTVDGWMKVSVAGTQYYVPMYTSKTT